MGKKGNTFGSTSKLPVNTGCQLKVKKEGREEERKKEKYVNGRHGNNMGTVREPLGGPPKGSSLTLRGQWSEAGKKTVRNREKKKRKDIQRLRGEGESCTAPSAV